MLIETKNERNSGIDLLKTVSMFMVVMLHVLGQGGVLKALPFASVQYFVARFIEIAYFKRFQSDSV